MQAVKTAPDVVVQQQPESDHWRRLTIIAQDPSIRDAAGNVVTSKVQVPNERLEPGPRGHRFHVVDYDPQGGGLTKPAIIEADLPSDLGSDDEAARAFHAQNVYAVAARTLASFESALGRRVRWGFGGHQLYVVPHAFEEANAYYAEDDHALYFGYFDGPDGKVFTCLSHDIVAHETTHAILDGLRDRFDTPGLPDQAAFHEAFADIVALLSSFALPNLIELQLGPANARGRIPLERVSEEALGATVGALAEQMAESPYLRRRDDKEIHGHSPVGLRNSLHLFRDPPADWRSSDEFKRPHRRGEILVACILGALIGIWRRRLVDDADQLKVATSPGADPEGQGDDTGVDLDWAAEEGALAAQHLLKMCIRGLDYIPPLEFEFADFLDALVISDKDIEPDDELGYRSALIAAFKRFGIVYDSKREIDVRLETVRFSYEGFNYIRMRSDADEIFRFVWQNDLALGIDLSFYTEIEQVREVTRVGVDGFVVSEVMVDYVQRLQATPAEIKRRLGVILPGGLPADKEVALFGGGVLIFDQFGRAKYHFSKELTDQQRQSDRMRYLLETSLADTYGRYGFSSGSPRGQRFAELHLPDARAAERW